ncbi:hypothetical protein [Mammaliicoccus sciuri]|uniref:hypothetical protein n=1 Tax=Mammaliicoccus sciuri TaxID=1296 RepID=UPI001FB4CDC3|nr:hypothetical protein [Mammaliicoccus sciuri]MCJ1778256.1 hypothetical protein [Mammaliicoccus sciuri]
MKRYVNEMNKTINKLNTPLKNIKTPSQIMKEMPFDKIFNYVNLMKKSWSNVIELVNLFDENAVKAFNYYEIPIHYMMTLDFISTIVEYYSEQKSIEEVNKYFIEYFNNNMFDLINNHWKNSELLSLRMNLFQQIEAGYKQKLYGLVVSTTTTQIEGIICDKLEIPRISKFKFKEKSLKNKYSNDTVQLKIIIEAIFSSEYFDDKITKEYYVSRIVSNNNNENNRHCIVHGSVYNYVNNIHAIKAIVIFDAILSRLEEFPTKDQLESVINAVALEKS